VNLSKPNPFLKTGLAGLLVTLLAACGNQSSKSLGDYTKIKNKMGPVHNTPSPVQTYVPSNLYMLEIDRTTSTNFVVGQRNVVRFMTALNLPGTRYRLVSGDLPRGAEPLKDLGNGIWEFAWTPSQELLPQNANEPIRGGFHVNLDIYEVTNSQSEALVPTLATKRTIDFTLMRSGAIPEIVEIAGIANYPQVTKLTEGDVLNLTITVKDTTATPSQKPRLVTIALPNRISQEQSKVSGHGFLFLETEPIMVKAGLWQFKAFFDTKNNSVPEFNVEGQPSLAPSLLADLAIQVLSPNRTVSPVKTLSFDITYRRELLKPSFKANPEVQLIAQGSSYVYEFESYLPSPIGTLVTYLSEETVRLPGNPKLLCRKLSKSNQHQSCKIEWKIPCSLQPGDQALKVVAAAEYQGQNTSGELVKKVSIVEGKKCASTKPKINSNPEVLPAPASEVTTPENKGASDQSLFNQPLKKKPKAIKKPKKQRVRSSNGGVQ
jgi:hypothetical protein